MNGHLIDQTMQRVARLACHGRSNPDFIIVHNRRPRGGTIHIPSPFDFGTIKIAANALGISKPVADGNVMPSRAGGKSLLRSPAMPLALVFVGFRNCRVATPLPCPIGTAAEQKVHASQAIL